MTLFFVNNRIPPRKNGLTHETTEARTVCYTIIQAHQ